MRDHTIRGKQTGDVNNKDEERKGRDRERGRERGRQKEKPPTWQSYIRTTERKSNTKSRDKQLIMLLDSAYTRRKPSELNLNVCFNDSLALF